MTINNPKSKSYISQDTTGQYNEGNTRQARQCKTRPDNNIMKEHNSPYNKTMKDKMIQNNIRQVKTGRNKMQDNTKQEKTKQDIIIYAYSSVGKVANGPVMFIWLS